MINYYSPITLRLKPLDFKEVEHAAKTLVFLNHAPQTIQEAFIFKSLIYWEGTYFLANSQRGCITRYGVSYQIYYSSGLTRGKILLAPKLQYSLSFRIAKPEYNLSPIVLIL